MPPPINSNSVQSTTPIQVAESNTIEKAPPTTQQPTDKLRYSPPPQFYPIPGKESEQVTEVNGQVPADQSSASKKQAVAQIADLIVQLNTSTGSKLAPNDLRPALDKLKQLVGSNPAQAEKLIAQGQALIDSGKAAGWLIAGHSDFKTWAKVNTPSANDPANSVENNNKPNPAVQNTTVADWGIKPIDGGKFALVLPQALLSTLFNEQNAELLQKAFKEGGAGLTLSYEKGALTVKVGDVAASQAMSPEVAKNLSSQLAETPVQAILINNSPVVLPKRIDSFKVSAAAPEVTTLAGTEAQALA